MPNPIPKLDHAIEVATLKYEIRQLLNAIKEHWEQKADDRCIEDDDKLYKAAGLPPCDRHVGDKTAMLINCARFISNRCEGGKWPSYVELEAKITKLQAICRDMLPIAEDVLANDDPDSSNGQAATALTNAVFYFTK